MYDGSYLVCGLRNVTVALISAWSKCWFCEWNDYHCWM